MDKKYYYLAGLDRSGNTLLSALLRQHPEIYASTLSPVCDYVWSVASNFSDNPAFEYYARSQKSKNILTGIFDSYYADIDKPIIFDRNKYWADYDLIDFTKQLMFPNPKIIMTIRDPLEIAQSFITVFRGSDYIDSKMTESGFIWDPHLSLDDCRVDYVLDSERGLIRQFRSFAHSYIAPENKGVLHAVQYNDLISNTQKVMSDIYNFIGVEDFINDTENIDTPEEDTAGQGLPANLHMVMPKIHDNKAKPEQFFSDYVLTKYETFRQEYEGFVKEYL